MSQYEYYEFQAIDRPLTAEEQQAVAQLSSRVYPHPRRAVFTYSFGGGLSRRAKDLLADYYDAMLYLSNWGSRRLMFRFPSSIVGLEQLQQYHVVTLDYPSEAVSVYTHGEHTILDIQLDEEEGYRWIEGEGWLDRLIALRDDILRGDYRLLYIAWLAALTTEYDIDDTAVEPPVPPGLQNLTPALRNFCELFEVDNLLIQVAAEASETLGVTSGQWMRQVIAQLSRSECEAFLLRLTQGEPHLDLALKRQLRELAGTLENGVTPRIPHRTVAQLLETLTEREKEELRHQAEVAERLRIERLEVLAQREERAWAEIDDLIQRKQAKPYDQATQLLCQLKELAAYQGQEAAFAARIGEIVDQYRRRHALIERFRRARLI